MVRVRAQAELAAKSDVPLSTRWHRAHGRQSMRDKAIKQQLLTPSEEKGLMRHVLQLARNGFPLPAKLLSSLAVVILQKRRAASDCVQACQTVRRPGRNWPLAFLRRHPELKARRVKPVDSKRHDHSIYDKSEEWFNIMEGVFKAPNIFSENMYNMDETGVMLSVPKSLRVLVGKYDLRNYRSAGVKRTLVTAIECISADGRSLEPLIIWPAATHRSTWTTHPTPGWHFACSKSGYTSSAINLYWIKHVFDPATRSRANGNPRVLISDGLAAHESIEVMTFCFENNIILCRLPSHTSHKLQPCDVGVFAPLKAAYRDQVEKLFGGGSNMIGKQHFTLLYDRARKLALTPRNIRAGWSRAGLWPFHREKVLSTMSRAPESQLPQPCSPGVVNQQSESTKTPQTPTSRSSLAALRSRAEVCLRTSNDDLEMCVEKIANAAEMWMAHCSLKDNRIELLQTQNNEKKVRVVARQTIIGKAHILSWDDIVLARQKKDQKATNSQRRVGAKGKPKGRSRKVGKHGRKSSLTDELAEAEREISRTELADFCTVFKVDSK